MAHLVQKYTRTAAVAAASLVGESKLFLVDYLLRLLRVALLLSIWRTLFAGHGRVGGMTLPTILTYTLVAEAFAEPLAGRTDLPDYFWTGTITTRFLRPMSLFGQFAAEAIGKWVFGFGLFSLPLLLLSRWMGVDPLPVNASAGVYFIVSLTLAVSVGMALENIFVAAGIWAQMQVWAIDRARLALSLLLSGALIPLALLPFHLGAIFELLPFASMASAPMRLYTGTGDPARMLGLQVAWSVLLWPIARLLWAASRERMVSHGG